MDRNTIIAIVLSVIVITVGMGIQTAFFTPEMTIPAEETAIESAGDGVLPSASGADITPSGADPDPSPFEVEAGSYIITFDPRGASVSSIKLAEHYDERNRSTASIDFYRKAYLNGYRQKLSLFRISIIYRKMRNYVSEKEYLILANKYEFKNLEPSNFEVEKSIVQRLKALQNVRIPKKLT